MSFPLISVIMPLYNKRRYVKRAIDSIKQQTYGNWELIIVDDGSTDGSRAKISQDDPRIRMFRQKNTGPSAARNKGVRKAVGEVISFIDADDEYYPEKLEIEFELLSKNEADWVISPCEYVKNNQREVLYFKKTNKVEIKSQPLPVSNVLNEVQLHVPVDGLLIKRKLFEEVGEFNENMRSFEVTELIVRCALKKPRVVICNRPLYRVVDVPDSAFKETLNKKEGLRQLGESFYRLSKNFPQYSYFLSSNSRKFLYTYIAISILHGNSKEARNYLTAKFPFVRDGKWWKLWAGSWVPIGILKKKYGKLVSCCSS